MLSCPLQLGRSLTVVIFVAGELKYRVSVLSDSIPKYIKMNNGRVEFQKGAKVVGYGYILVYIGINDLSE